MSDDLTGLGPRGFERMCQALATYALGPGMEAFGSGPDGGREASFHGLVPFPSDAERWNGYVILQAKFKERILGTSADTTWLRKQVKGELEAWTDSNKARVRQGQRPEYLIIATNVPLSGVPGSGGKARINKLIDSYRELVGLKDWRIWDAGQITALLNAYPQVRRAFAALITPSDVLAEMRDKLDTPPEVSVVLSVPAPTIAPGQPGCEAAFSSVYNAAGGAARLGLALSEVYESDIGYVQHFVGGASGEPAVICTLHGRKAVAVAQSVWDEICAIGDGQPGGGSSGAGFPVGSRPPAVFISPDSQEIELNGGQWGSGRLIHGTPDTWVWQPKIAFDSLTTSDRAAWSTNNGEMDLRIRLAAQIPIVGHDLRVTETGRRQMLAALSHAQFNETVLAAARKRGLNTEELAWGETPDLSAPNNTRFATYQAAVPGSNQQQAFLANLWFMLPDSYRNGLSSIADLRINFEAIRQSKPAGIAQIPADLRLTRDELIDFFAHAWIATTTMLPLTAQINPLEAPPAGAPRLELHIQNERPEGSGKPRPLSTLELVDFSYYGQPRKTSLSDMSVGIKFPLGLHEDEIISLVSQGLARMTEDFGFPGKS